MPQVMDADRMARALTRIAHEIVERNRGTSELALVGIRTRGVPLARRISAALKGVTHEDVPTRSLHITPFPHGPKRPPLCPQPGAPPPRIPFSIRPPRLPPGGGVVFYGGPI